MKKINLLRKMKRERQMTKNEKTLLMALGVAIVFWASFRFILIPQYNKLQALNDEKAEYEQKISQMNLMLKKEDKIEKKLEDLRQEEIALTTKYFSAIDQPQLIYLLNDMLDNENIDVLDINFSKPREENIADYPINTMDIYIPYRANYEGLIEILREISLSSKKLLITNLTIDKDKDELLTGNISIKVYCLEGREGNSESVYVNTVINNEKDNPFLPFDNYNPSTDENLPIFTDENVRNLEEDLIEDKYNKELLEDFESGSFNFIPSTRYVKGNISKSLNAKSNRYSMRFEYNILALENENRAYMDLNSRNIVLKYPPSSIGLWIYSYGYSPITLGFRMMGQAGEKLDIELTKGISWLGWNYIEANPPEDISLYPLQLDKIYIELPYNRDDYGLLLFDKIEANYPSENVKTKESFTFYIVEENDTLEKISMKFYGNIKNRNIIMKYNEINSDKDIREGKILVIPR